MPAVVTRSAVGETERTEMCKRCQAMLDMLAEIKARTCLYIYGATAVAAARGLERAGLVTLQDNGSMVLNGRSDRERWFVQLKKPDNGMVPISDYDDEPYGGGV